MNAIKIAFNVMAAILNVPLMPWEDRQRVAELADGLGLRDAQSDDEANEILTAAVAAYRAEVEQE